MSEENTTFSNSELLQKVQMAQLMEFRARVDDLNALQDAYGDEVVNIIQTARAEKTKQRWRAVAERFGRNDINGLKQTLWKIVGEAGAEFTFEDNPEGTKFCVTKCPLADMAKQLGAEKWGFLFYCEEDKNIAQGFNENIGFSRTKTIMEGHDCCDHYYFLKTKA